VCCFRGFSVEEVLYEVANVFQQAGNPALADVLVQRAHLRLKIAVLFECLKSSPFLLWLDDFDCLFTSQSADEAADEEGPLRYFLDGCLTLDGGLGRMVITTRSEFSKAHMSAADTNQWALMELEKLSPERAQLFWQTHGGVAERLSTIGAAGRRWGPFTMELLALAGNNVETDVFAELLELDDETATERLLGLLMEPLGPSAHAVLQASTALPPEPSRQGFHDVTSSLGVPLDVKKLKEDSTLRELESRGLLRLPPESSAAEPWNGAPIAVASPVRQYVERRLQNDSPDTWKKLRIAAGSYFLRLGNKSGSLWHFVSGWRGFLEGECFDEAYEIQKFFVEQLIQCGYPDFAKHVLEETIRTTTGIQRAVVLGNLAIIYKMQGDFARALEIYRQVEQEFLSMGDEANLGRVLHQIGNTHYMNGEYAEAIASYTRSLEISERLGDRSVIAATRIQMANVLYQCGERQEALERYLETLEDARVANDHGLLAVVELQIGQIHYLQKRYLDAEAHLKEADASARACGDLRNLVKVLEAEGTVAQERRAYDLAREHFGEALRTAETLGDALEGAAILVLSGDLERERLQLSEALRCYHKAKDLLQSYAARGAVSQRDLEALTRKVDERLSSLEENMGPAAFKRLRE
jgi:tetratricopeptide (TPR) repeat protein